MKLQRVAAGAVLIILILVLVCGGCSKEDCKLCAPCDTCATCDATAPAAVVDLVANDPTVHNITLEWTSPGDDGNSGTASQYDMRYSTSTITETNWCSAQQVTNESAPKPSGQQEVFVVEGLAEDTIYCFALKTTDERWNWSSLSNVASARTLSVTGLLVSTQNCLNFSLFVWIDDEFYGSFTNEAPILIELQPGLHRLYARANIIIDGHTFCWTRDFTIVDGQKTTVDVDCNDGVCPIGAGDSIENTLTQLRP